jgi:hypothetical protein
MNKKQKIKAGSEKAKNDFENQKENQTEHYSHELYMLKRNLEQKTGKII